MAWYKDKIFWLITAAAAVLKGALFFYLYSSGSAGEQALIFPDSLGYIYPAQTWLSYGSFWEAVSTFPMLLRTPGYPLFLAAVHALTGSATWGVVAVQNLLALLLPVPVYLSARRLGDLTAARWAAGFCAASVLYFSLAFAVLTETVCVFLLAWFVYVLLVWAERPHPARLVTAAVLLAAATYVRPVVYYFIAVSCIELAGWAFRQKSRGLAKQVLCCFALPVIVLVGAWQVRNYRQTGYGGFTSVGAYNLYIWNEDFVARQDRSTVAQAHQKLLALLPPDFNTWPAEEQVRTYRKLAAPLLRQSGLHKLVRLPLWAGKTLLGTNQAHLTRLLGLEADEPQKTLNQTGALPLAWLKNPGQKMSFAAALLQVFAVVLLGLGGLVLLWKSKPFPALFLTVYILYFWGLGSSFFGAYARFRAPFEFVLCITAGLLASVCQKALIAHRQTIN